jgi:predicted amino acid-binding ACT domain protein
MGDNEMENWLMLTLVGKDRPGIVAKISHALLDM